MKKLFYLILFITAVMTGIISCDSQRTKIRIIETGERAYVSHQALYKPGDTVIVLFSPHLEQWRIDKHWIPFSGTRYATSSVMYYKAVIE
jgi:hypothetical protein